MDSETPGYMLAGKLAHLSFCTQIFYIFQQVLLQSKTIGVKTVSYLWGKSEIWYKYNLHR